MSRSASASLGSGIDPEGRYAADAAFGTALEEVRAAGVAPPTLARAALAVLTPACLGSGRQGRGLELLEARGFRLVFGRHFTFTLAAVEEVWRYQSFEPQRWRVICDLLLAGPSLLLLLGHPDPPADLGAAGLLQRVKGPSDPRLDPGGSVRAELGAMNKVVNLLHTADSAADAVRELGILLPAAELRGALRALAGGTVADARARAELVADASVARRVGAPSAAHVAGALRWRAAALLTSLPQAADAALLAALAGELAWLDGLGPVPGRAALERYRARLAGAPQAQHAQAAARRCAPADRAHAEALATVFAELERLVLNGGGDPDVLGAAAERAGLHVDVWDRLVLATEQITSGDAAGGAPPASPGGPRR